ncbi:hypothetical protein ADEAN_000562600 [Angomonas deanei]|uniref:Uncharacterized protein n=1 Tax=Angomonas deanei TaxID=59799 RepID=A0A7G2CE62_9TRYP|nr:hypothetical protein ADEAN_000562600 [Angomonas deanei]
MGTHLSRDEILFTSLRWEELYEEAQQRYLTAPHGANQNDKESNPFLLSHIEWQALLGSLQEGKMKNRKEAIPFSSGPTTLCSMKIDKSTLHEPLVVLTVHAIAWIRGVFHTQQEGNHLNENSDEIDKNADTIFFDKVEALLDVLNDVSWHTPVASDEEGGDNGGEESSSSEDGEMEEQEEEEPITSREVHQPANEDNHNDHETKSKRQRLWAAAVGVKNKVQRRGNNNNKDMDRQTSKNEFTTRSSNSCPRSNLFTCFQRLYDILLISRNREGSSS